MAESASLSLSLDIDICDTEGVEIQKWAVDDESVEHEDGVCDRDTFCDGNDSGSTGNDEEENGEHQCSRARARHETTGWYALQHPD